MEVHLLPSPVCQFPLILPPYPKIIVPRGAPGMCHSFPVEVSLADCCPPFPIHGRYRSCVCCNMLWRVIIGRMRNSLRRWQSRPWGVQQSYLPGRNPKHGLMVSLVPHMTRHYTVDCLCVTEEFYIHDITAFQQSRFYRGLFFSQLEIEANKHRDRLSPF